MLKKAFVRLTILAGLALPIHLSQAQPASGVYEIISGRYRECCGIAGGISYALPDSDQRFVELTVDSQRRIAQMKILGADGQTVFRIPSSQPRPEFVYSLSNGVVFPDRIEFGETPVPGPVPGSMSSPPRYTVRNDAGGLQINGSLTLPCPGCADFFTQFKHTNVVAAISLPPGPVIEGVERDGALLRFRFTGEPPNDYFVEFSESLPASSWLSLTNFRAKIQPIEAVVTDPLGSSKARFYRIRKQDCQCD